MPQRHRVTNPTQSSSIELVSDIQLPLDSIITQTWKINSDIAEEFLERVGTRLTSDLLKFPLPLTSKIQLTKAIITKNDSRHPGKTIASLHWSTPISSNRIHHLCNSTIFIPMALNRIKSYILKMKSQSTGYRQTNMIRTLIQTENLICGLVRSKNTIQKQRIPFQWMLDESTSGKISVLIRSVECQQGCEVSWEGFLNDINQYIAKVLPAHPIMHKSTQATQIILSNMNHNLLITLHFGQDVSESGIEWLQDVLCKTLIVLIFARIRHLKTLPDKFCDVNIELCHIIGGLCESL